MQTILFVNKAILSMTIKYVRYLYCCIAGIFLNGGDHTLNCAYSKTRKSTQIRQKYSIQESAIKYQKTTNFPFSLRTSKKIVRCIDYRIFGLRKSTVLPFVTNFRVFPLCTLSVFRFTASTEIARHACVSTPSTSICDCNTYCYKHKNK